MATSSLFPFNGETMNTYLIVKDDLVINVVLWDGVSEWTSPNDSTIELAPEGVGIGWKRVGEIWVAPEPSTPQVENQTKVSARAKLAALGLTDEEISALIGGI